ncbi:uncharacterized protein PFL1_05123 [Pseudozyma flocculosa PF-1]|nr:uncharacterized protein PFL1_05123 [Pseudozyma flocculosa PF-1]EPQ27200.1 hypothetical protein PFL1_05123 [Pseudozyma flocculosa PF-1]
MGPSTIREPCLDLVDPRILTGSWRHKTVWTFWDCLAPFGARDNDLLILSNDGMAFPCADFNPYMHSEVLQRSTQNPRPEVTRILQHSREENELIFGFQPQPALTVDEDWRATNLLLLLVHPIPALFLPDRATASLALRLGFDYQVSTAIQTALRRLRELDEIERSEAVRPPAP